MKNSMLAVCAAVVVFSCLLAPPRSCAASETGDSPEAVHLEIVQSGVFAPVLPGAGTPKGGRYRLIRAGEAVEAVPGVAFGVVFEVRGKPAGQVVMVEAGLSPQSKEPVPPSGTQDASARRWFIPVVVGETAQAVVSFAYAWEVVPGRWRLTLAEGGRVLAEKDFLVGGSETAASQAGTSSADSVAPVASPDSGPDHGTPPPHKPEGTATPDQAASTSQTQPHPSAPSSPAAPGVPTGPDSGKAAAKDARETGKKSEAKAQAVPDTAPAENKTAGPPAPKAPEKTLPKSVAKPAGEAASAAKGTAFLLQTGLFSKRDNALAEAARYRAKGYPGCVLEEGVGAKKRFRVVVGRFSDRDRAVAARRSFVAREGGEAVIKEVPAAEAGRRLICR